MKKSSLVNLLRLTPLPIYCSPPPVTDETIADKSLLPTGNAEALVTEEPASHPPSPLLDLTRIKEKCQNCKERRFSHVSEIYCIDTLETRPLYAPCLTHCKSCENRERDILPVNSEPIQEFLRNFDPPNKNTSFKPLKCWYCHEPCTTDLFMIDSLSYSRHTVKAHFNCTNGCSSSSHAFLPFRSEPIQKLIKSLI